MSPGSLIDCNELTTGSFISQLEVNGTILIDSLLAFAADAYFGSTSQVITGKGKNPNGTGAVDGVFAGGGGHGSYGGGGGNSRGSPYDFFENPSAGSWGAFPGKFLFNLTFIFICFYFMGGKYSKSTKEFKKNL